MNSIHTIFTLTFPRMPHYDLSLKRLFALLDRFDVKQRQEMIEQAYFCFDCSSGEEETEHWREDWYESFKHQFAQFATHCREESFVVYGLLSYVLSRALEKSDPERFVKLISRHQDTTEFVEEMKDVEIDEIEDLTTLVLGKGLDPEHAKRSIDSLRNEIKECRRAYDAFCEQIIKPLMERQEPLTHPPGAPPSRS